METILLAHGCAWTLTGESRWQASWLGHAVLVVEECRREFRPIYTGHSPANWRVVKRWRRARLSDLCTAIPESRQIPLTTLNIPMPLGTKPPPPAPKI